MRAAALGSLGRKAEAAPHLEDLMVACPDFIERHQELLLILLFRPDSAQAVRDGLIQAGLRL